MYGYFCIGFIDFMIKDLQNRTKMFSITKKSKMKKISWIICRKYLKFKNTKISYIKKNVSSFYRLH